MKELKRVIYINICLWSKPKANNWMIYVKKVQEVCLVNLNFCCVKSVIPTLRASVLAQVKADGSQLEGPRFDPHERRKLLTLYQMDVMIDPNDMHSDLKLDCKCLMVGRKNNKTTTYLFGK